MKILQISDLHLSPDSEHLFKQRWDHASACLDGPFDFIVVSGDIADKAGAADYGIAFNHLRELVPLVKGGDRARIVIVPGNHDVSWEPPVGRMLEAAEIERERKRLEELLDWGPEWPPKYDRRFEISFDTPTRVWAVNDAEYAHRFTPFANFLKDFYDPPLAKPHRTFVANARDSREHWSAHVFPDDKIAFFGLSSCLITDKHSRSAGICEDALTDIKKYMAAHAQGLRKVAVWHHGIVSPRGRPDSVSRAELASLRSKGFFLGLHGHTHHDARERVTGGYYDDLLVLGTGAFSVSPEQREEGYNQFSIIELKDDETIWTVFDYKRDTGWIPRAPMPFRKRAPSPTWADGAEGNVIKRHTREITVDKDGIATVKVNMAGLSLKKQLTVGTPSPGFTNVHWDPSPRVDAPKHNARVAITVDPAGQKPFRRGERIRQQPYRFVASSTKKPIEVDSLEWWYSISNGFALDEVDATMGLYPGRQDLSLGSNDDAVDGFAYRVEDETKELKLSLQLPETSEILQPTLVADRGDHSASEIDWNPDADDEARATLERPAKNRVVIEVKDPRVGSRYGVSYHLGRGKTALDNHFLGCINQVIEDCRRTVPSRAPVLTAAVGEALRNALSKKPLNLTDLKFWTAHLWDSRSKKLLVCFGEFWIEHWSSSFNSGQGIAGHAFRMCEGTVYCLRSKPAQARDKRSLLYLPRAESDEAHQVVIELPILFDRDHAVGTIGFSARDDDGQSNQARDRLRHIAEQTFGSDARAVRAKRLLDTVATQASRAFWAEVKNSHPKVAEEAAQRLRGRSKPKV